MLLCLGWMALVVAQCAAQTTGSIFGTVTDESGAVVAEARIVAVNTLTNEARVTRSNQLGNFTLPALPLGTYTVRCELEGFRTWVQQGIELSLNRNARLDIRLTIGALTEKVTVAGDAPLVESTTNEMGTLVDQRRVADLPLNGRNTLSLVSLIPGAGPFWSRTMQTFRVNSANINGVRMEDSNWLLDGGDNTVPLRNYGNQVPNPDAIQEFRVITNNYGAEYGRSVGGVVNVVTKSGANALHGSAFEFVRNRRLNARNFFEPDTTPLVQNQFGASLGGPIRRDKMFFFGSYQGFRRRTADFRDVALVPTEAERAGDFSRSVTGTGAPVVIRDPLTRQPFPNARIPLERHSRVAVNYLKLAIPLPNYPVKGVNGLYQRESEPTDSNEILGKVDYLISDKHKVSAGYFVNDSNEGNMFGQEVDFIRLATKSRQHNLNVHEYWTIGPTMLNHFRATYSRNAGNAYVTPDDVSLADLGANFTPLPEGPKVAPGMRVVGYFDARGFTGGPKISNHYTLANTFDWVKGRHNLKFGAEGWLRKFHDVSMRGAQGGEFEFDGSSSGNSLADLMLGLARRFEYANPTYKSNNAWASYWFIQDSLRVTPRLALTLGIRYELDTWPTHPVNQLVAFMPWRKSTCVPQAPAGVLFPCDEGVPRAGAYNDLNNYAPRFGMAYDLFGDGKTVVRAGYGISYAFAIYNTLQGQQISTPFALRETVQNVSLEDPYAQIGGSPFPFNRDPANLKFPVSGAYNFQDLHQRNGYIQQYNLSIQRQLGSDWTLEAAYVGNVGRKLAGSVDINAPLRTPNASSGNVNQRRPWYPTFLATQQQGGFVNSSYNALQVRAEKRFSRGFTVLSSYTLSKALDEASWYDSANSWLDPGNRALNKGLADFDSRQSLVVSWIWETPFFRKARGLRHSVLGGWTLNGILTLYAGQPVSYDGSAGHWILTDKDNDYSGHSGNDRPDVIGDWKLSPNRPRSEVIRAWFRRDAFRPNAAGQLGNLGRNVVIGPGSKSVTLGVFKNFRITEKQQLQFRCELFNAFNWVNLQSVESRLSKPTFGQVTTAGDPRIVQFGLKYAF